MWKYCKQHPWVGAVPLFFLIALGISLASCTEAEATEVRIGAVLMAPGDSIRVSVAVTPAAGVDSTRITVTSSTGASQTRTLGGASKGTLLFLFPSPAEGQTATGQATAISYRLGVASPVSAAKAWTFTRPVTAPPPPVIDSVTVQQIAMALSEATRVQPVGVVLASGDTCAAELRDYYGAMLIASVGSPSAACQTTWNDVDRAGSVGHANAVLVAVVLASHATTDSASVAQWQARKLALAKTPAPVLLTMTDGIPQIPDFAAQRPVSIQ